MGAGLLAGLGIAEGMGILGRVEITGCPRTCTGGRVEQQEQTKAKQPQDQENVFLL